MITISISNSDEPGKTMIFEGDLCIVAVSRKSGENPCALDCNAGVLGHAAPYQVVGTQIAALTAVSQVLGDNTAARRELVVKSLEIMDPATTRLAKGIVETMRGGAMHAN